MDIDGVLTDGTFTWDSAGGESKSFAFADIMGLSRARAAGISLGLISGEDGPIVKRLAEKIGATYVAAGCRNKAAALREFSEASQIPLEHIAYIGDDVNDIDALSIAGLSVAPLNAQSGVKRSVDLVLEKTGGDGAVRQLIELLLAADSKD